MSTSSPPVAISDAPATAEREEVALPPANSARSAVSWILFAIGTFALVGVGFALWLRTVAAGLPDVRMAYNVFYVLFGRHEPLGLATVAVFSFAFAWFFRRRSHTPDRSPDAAASISSRAPRIVLWLALAVFAISSLGTSVVSHNYLLTGDENAADFQARIFLRGKITAEVPDQWAPVVRMLKPTFIDFLPSTQSWKAAYLPVYAAMRAVFQSVDLQGLLNPLLAAISVLALYGTARNIWPDDKKNAVIAAALLGTSSQVLLMATTGYAMSAHLALNTVWLWLYSQPDRRRFYLAPVLGVFAIGLHQPIVHALFAAPFLLRLVLQRKWRPTVVFALIYLAGCAGWAAWQSHYSSPSASGANPFSIFKLVNPRMAIIQPMNLLLIIGWGSLALPLLTFLGFRRVFRLPPILQDAALSCILTFGFYYFFHLDQAHGWGYRYFHGVFSCLVLVAVVGWRSLIAKVGERPAHVFLGAALAASLLIQLPLRCFQVEAFVRPYARTAALIHSLPVNLVAVDPNLAWYSTDLIRNDPFLESRPLVVSLYSLDPDAIKVLSKAGTVRFVERETLTQLGLSTTAFDGLTREAFFLGRGE